MNFLENLMSKLSIPGLVLLTLGAVLIFQSEKLCRLVFKENADKVLLPMTILGLALALFGALILLDFIPGL